MTHTKKRLLAMLLAVVLCFSSLPFSVSANEVSSGPPTESTVESQPEETPAEDPAPSDGETLGDSPSENDSITISDSSGDVPVGAQSFNLGEVALMVLAAKFGPPTVGAAFGLLNLFSLIALAYCVLKVFFANIKRGGILLIQMAVGSLYLFSVPRGYTDGFSQWCKQIFALCLTAFLQTVLLFLGLLTFQDNLLLGLGIMLAAGEVPRIAQQFGLDSSVKVNMMSVVHATSTAVNMTKNIAKAL